MHQEKSFFPPRAPGGRGAWGGQGEPRRSCAFRAERGMTHILREPPGVTTKAPGDPRSPGCILQTTLVLAVSSRILEIAE